MTEKKTTTKKKATAKRKKRLVIVESPAKAKTIEKYLGPAHYKVMATKGHLRDLPKSRMGIDVDNYYAPDYITVRGRGETIKELKREAKKASAVFLASDPDREGEAIAWHLAHILDLDPNDNIRVEFNEITKEAVKESFQAPRPINLDLVDAQQARRILDRLVGYSISPLLWKKVKSGLSAGRVQSVALKMIIDREDEIRNFTPEEYWSIDGVFLKGQEQFKANFYSFQGEKLKLSNEETVKEVMSNIEDKPFNVTNITRSQRKRNPYAPFTTSTLQQEAGKRINFRTSKTMMVAQQLYEGIKLGAEGTVGLITYMRTDSTRIATTAAHSISNYIEKEYGSDYLNTTKRPKTTSPSAQDAHEAIRPTSVDRHPGVVKEFLTPDQYKLYSLIWTRAVASFMTPAVFDTMRVDIEQNEVVFRANGNQLKFPGYQKVYTDNRDNDSILPNLEEGEEVRAKDLKPEQHFTQPPARYTEAGLVKVMEESGIGRPSTYSPTINTLVKRYYVKLEAKRFEPTELGEIVNKLMVEYFPRIVDVHFTADMENELDEIADGEKEWVKVIDNFYQPFSTTLSKAEEEIEKIEIKDEPAGFDCDLCGSPMVIKMGRYGKFYACSNFPECRNTKAIVKEIGVKCPKCKEGEVIERKSKKNRIFYGCSRYPDCDFVSWDKPIQRPCPRCSEYLVEKKIRGGKQIKCSSCDYQEEPQK